MKKTPVEKDLLQWKMDSQIGPLYLVASERALHGVFWKGQTAPMIATLTGSDPKIALLKTTKKQIEEYLEGKRKRFDLPLSSQGTAFQEQVWSELRKIPYGETCSYRDIAKRIKNAKAVRAVGTANGRNPLSIIVPCHRVITSSGTLGGYAGGLDIKTQLLELETRSTRSGSSPK